MRHPILGSLGITLALIALFTATPASAVATITIVNNDGAGEGFNDPTPVVPSGGNPAHTLGAARLIAVQHAAFLWGSMLDSDVEILVQANFDPLGGNANSAPLAGAGATTVHGNFAGAPVFSTWYPQALANSLAGSDLAPQPDIGVTFNTDVDGNVVLGATHWYYGLDGNSGGDIDLVSVALHELGHGLGFQTFVDLTNGQKLGGFNDTYMLNLVCPSCLPDRFSDMSNAQRVAAAINDPNLQWDGLGVSAAAAAIPLTNGFFPGNQVQMNAPNPLELGSSVSHFSDAVSPDELMEPFYTNANHDVSLARNLMEDIGWNLHSQTGTDVVFILDITGSTGSLVGGWFAQIPAIAQAWLDHDPGSRFAVVTHVDYPFAPYGDTGEWAYRVETAFTPNVANVQAALGALAQEWGNDSPESQYEAIYQVLTGAGRDLNGDADFNDPGEIVPTGLGQLNPMVIYHFTYPQLFHNRDVEPNYPFPGSSVVAGETLTTAELAVQSGLNMFFGLTFISDAALAPGAEPTLSPLKDLTGGTSDPLLALAAVSGGRVYGVGNNDLSKLQEAIDASIEHWSRRRPGYDFDRDGVPDRKDNCRLTANRTQSDADRDGVGDACDNCPEVFNPDQRDFNRNGVGDACERSR